MDAREKDRWLNGWALNNQTAKRNTFSMSTGFFFQTAPEHKCRRHI